MRLPRPLLVLSTSLAGLIASASACAATARALDFRDIEYRYQGGDALTPGQQEIAAAIAIGSSAADGVLLLRAAGARCRALHADPDAVRCLYNQMSSNGDALDEVRWTTILRSRDGRVTDVSVRRDVDIRVIE